MEMDKPIFNYSYLRAWIKDNKGIGSNKRFAQIIGVSVQELNQKLKSEHYFTQKQIQIIKDKFGLTGEQVNILFFTLQLQN